MNGKKVLILEDDIDIKNMYSEFWDFLDLTFADSGEEALSTLKWLKPDMIVADLSLAGKMDGMDFIKQLREKNRDQTPVVIVSGKVDMKKVNEALTYHVSEVISKPLKKEQLIDLARRKLI